MYVWWDTTGTWDALINWWQAELRKRKILASNQSPSAQTLGGYYDRARQTLSRASICHSLPFRTPSHRARADANSAAKDSLAPFAKTKLRGTLCIFLICFARNDNKTLHILIPYIVLIVTECRRGRLWFAAEPLQVGKLKTITLSCNMPYPTHKTRVVK